MSENTKPTFEETYEWLQTTDYNKGIGVTALFRVKEEHLENFIALLEDYIPYVLKEEGCIDYGFHRDWRNSNDIWLTEKWVSPKILVEHLGPNARKGTKYEGSAPLDKFAKMEVFPDPAAIYKIGL
ncbi:putative quinol monooxygenase [Lutibacter citreus]|uniref:putative quinol monooxygenase n=1 Tax=Lutibacter citreus TaxID=2138210 RepID=UPI000DBE2B6D|nr:antibiotic biosynthesis monooxygenase family protein [Lutibacter citreus]